MRLIRLNTQDTNLFFNNSIQEDIKLSPDSKIALVNMNFEKEEKELIIDGTNSKLTNTYDTLSYENDLPDNTITRNNFRELLYMLDYTLQEKVAIKEFADPYVPKSIGLLYNSRFSSDNMTVIETDQQPLFNPLQLAIDSPDSPFYTESGFSTTAPGFYKAEDGSNALLFSTSLDFPSSTDMSTVSSFQGTKRCCVFTLSVHAITANTVGGRFGIAPNPSACDMTNLSNFLFGITAHYLAILFFMEGADLDADRAPILIIEFTETFFRRDTGIKPLLLLYRGFINCPGRTFTDTIPTFFAKVKYTKIFYRRFR